MTWTDTEHIVSDPEVCGINHDPPSPTLADPHRRDPRHGGGGWGVGVGGVVLDGAGMIRRFLRWLGPLIPPNSRGSQPRIPANPNPPPPVRRHDG